MSSSVSTWAGQTIDDTPGPTWCITNGGTLSGINRFNLLDNGTLGTESGAPDQSPATNPYTGVVSGGIYAQYGSGTGGFRSPTFGEYSYVANIQTPRNSFQHDDITDPVYGAAGRFFSSDPREDDTPTMTITLTGLTPNEFYEYSFWAANSEPNGAPNNVDIIIDGESVFSTGPLTAVPAALAWKKYAFTFSSGPNTSVTIDLKSTEIGESGNDFYLDNIEVQDCDFSTDYGDAPASYGEALHTTIPAAPTVYLGTVAPDDESATPLGGDAGAGADGDDATGDDEDAFVVLPDVSSTSTYSLTNIPVNNTSGGDATLHAWVDFDQDGQFSVGEYQSTTVNNNATTANLSWSVPAGITSGDTYARFRISQNELIADDIGTTEIDERSKDAVIAGEVEDYVVSIVIEPDPLPAGALPNSTPSPPTSLSCHNAVFGDFVPDRAPFAFTGNVPPRGRYSVDTVWTATALDGTVATLRTVAVNNISGKLVSTGPDPDVFFIDFTDPNTGFVTPKLTEREGDPGDSWDLEIEYSRPIGSARVLVGDIDSFYGDGGNTRFKDIIRVEGFLGASSVSSSNTYRGTVLVESLLGNRHTFADNPAATNNNNPGNTDGLGPNPSDSATTNRIVVDYVNTFVDRTEITYAVGAPLDGSATQSVFMTSGMAAGCQISGNAFEDASGNDLLDTSENRLPAVAVTIYKDDGDNVLETNGDDLLIETRDTQGIGDYLFTNLAETETYWVDIDTADADLTDYRYGGGDVEVSQVDPRTVDLFTSDVGGVNFPFDPFVEVRLALVKRITAINRGLADEQLFDTTWVDVGAADDDDNEVNWPGAAVATTFGGSMVEGYIAGIDETSASPGDVVEYTIPFLSMGDGAAQNVLICDRIPTHTTFVGDAFNAVTPASPGGGDRGIFIDFNNDQVALTNANDGDEITDTGAGNEVGGYYFPAGVDPSTAFLGLTVDCGGGNTNGAIVVNLNTIPNATGEGSPANAYGFIRFRVVVD